MIIEVGTMEEVTGVAYCLHNFLCTDQQRSPIQLQTHCPPFYRIAWLKKSSHPAYFRLLKFISFSLSNLEFQCLVFLY